MVKKIHYIKEDYSGDIERYCLETYKKIYPDYEFCAWKPGSSPSRILYDNGGLFIAPNILAMKPISESLLNKPFITFNNRFETTEVNFSICYADKPNCPIFLEFMEKGVYESLWERGFKNDYKVGLAEKDYKLNDIRILNRYNLGFDKGYLELYDSCFLDMNIHMEPVENINLHYIIIDDNTNLNNLYMLADNYGKNFKNENESKHSLFLINNCSPDKYDLVSKTTALLIYLCTTPGKYFNIINTGNTNPETVNKIITEYIGKKYNNLKSCERLF